MSFGESSTETVAQVEFRGEVSFATLESAPSRDFFLIDPLKSDNDRPVRFEANVNRSDWHPGNRDDHVTVILGPGDETGNRPMAIYNTDTHQRYETDVPPSCQVLCDTTVPGGMTNSVIRPGYDVLLLEVGQEAGQSTFTRSMSFRLNRIRAESN